MDLGRKMVSSPVTSRRDFLRLAMAAASSGLASGLTLPTRSVAQPLHPVRIVSNSGAENNTLQQLLKDLGYLERLELAPELVGVTTPAATLEALVSGKADVCMISGFNGLLPAIESGAPVRVLGAAMRLPALVIYTKANGVMSLNDVVGRRVGIGPEMGLLHAIMVGALKKKGIDPASVQFVPIGSNAQVFQAVAEGKVDAGPADVANMERAGRLGVKPLADGAMWKELPEYPYQLVYASTNAIARRRDALVRTLAGYAQLYRFLSAPSSWPAYSRARMAATGESDAEAGRPAWTFIQDTKPFAVDIAVSSAQIEFLQTLHVAIGSQKQVQPFEQVADMSLARDALRLLG
jgi:NitT/TauT family transport system substrate-binding protein